MARKYTKKKIGKKRTFRKKKMTRRQTVGFMGNGQALLNINAGLGFPLRYRTKLRYVETTTMAVTSGVMAVQAYRANGIYDPNQTGAGHQPMFFDQLMTIYNHYKVLGSKITVEVTPQGTALATPSYVTLWIDDDATYSGTFGQALELGVLKNYTIIGGNSRTITTRLRQNWSLKKWFKDKYNAAQVTGNSGADPAELSYFLIGAYPLDGSSSVTYNVIVTIDYIADFFELKDVAQS